MDLNLLADTLDRFSDIGVVGCALLFTIAIVTGQVFTKKQVEEIRATFVADDVVTATELTRLRTEIAQLKAEVTRLQRSAARRRKP